jgi:hypothetical protein
VSGPADRNEPVAFSQTGVREIEAMIESIPSGRDGLQAEPRPYRAAIPSAARAYSGGAVKTSALRSEAWKNRSAFISSLRIVSTCRACSGLMRATVWNKPRAVGAGWHLCGRLAIRPL